MALMIKGNERAIENEQIKKPFESTDKILKFE